MNTKADVLLLTPSSELKELHGKYRFTVTQELGNY